MQCNLLHICPLYNCFLMNGIRFGTYFVYRFAKMLSYLCLSSIAERRSFSGQMDRFTFTPSDSGMSFYWTNSWMPINLLLLHSPTRPMPVTIMAAEVWLVKNTLMWYLQKINSDGIERTTVEGKHETLVMLNYLEKIQSDSKDRLKTCILISYSYLRQHL